MEAQISTGLPQGQELWLQQSREVQCGTKLFLEEVAISSTIEPPNRQSKNWKTIVSEKLWHVGKVLAPTTYPQPGDLTKGLITPREFDFEGQWDLIMEFPQDWRRVLEGTNKTLFLSGTRRKKQRFHKRLHQTWLCVSRNLLQRHGSKVVCRGISTKYNSPGSSKNKCRW